MAGLTWGPRAIMLLQGREKAGVPTAWELEKLKDFPGINLDTYSVSILPKKAWGLANESFSMREIDRWDKNRLPT